ncbi:MAG: GTP-binding protein, partial [Pseudomonadota bacterium]
NRLLQDPSLCDAAVIINEFGSVPLDHLLVERSDDDIIELSSGCLCCTIRGELIATLERLLDRSDDTASQINRIIIETTGLADPVPVLQAILAHPHLSTRFTLGGVVTLVDAVNGLATLTAYGEARRQVALADQLVITKLDAVDGSIPAALCERIAALNPDAPLLESGGVDAAIFGAQAFDLATKDDDLRHAVLSEEDHAHDAHNHDHNHDHAHGHSHDVNRHGDSIQSFVIQGDNAFSKPAIRAFLELLTSAHGTKLLRVKGLVKLGDHPAQPLVLHGVQSVFHEPYTLPAWPSDDQTSRLVFITDGLEPRFVQTLFDGFSNTVSVDSPDAQALSDNPLSVPGFTSARS